MISFFSSPMPFWQLFRHLPWFETTILKPIYDNNFRFESDQHISEFRTPVMILHSENDRVIPFELGYQLYRSALETRGKAWGPVEFHRFEGKYGHKFIVKSNNFAGTIDQFIRRYRDATYWTPEQQLIDELFILSFEFFFTPCCRHNLQFTTSFTALHSATFPLA